MTPLRLASANINIELHMSGILFSHLFFLQNTIYQTHQIDRIV